LLQLLLVLLLKMVLLLLWVSNNQDTVNLKLEHLAVSC
jgi:hypothetical protein